MSLGQDRMQARVNSAFAASLQHRARRRALVAATVVSAALIAFAIYQLGDQIHWVSLATVPYWGCAYLLNLSLRGIFELDDDHLDEHQIGERNRAYKAAYGAAVVFLIVVVTAATVASLDQREMISVAAFAFLVTILAPRLLVGWAMEEPDELD